MTLSPGDAVLYAVSARRSVPWDAFRAAIDATFPGGELGTAMKYLRSEAAAVGDSLGHWDITDECEKGLRISIAPPVFARLPWPGVQRAVLCGSRSPHTSIDIHAACRTLVNVSARTVPQQALHLYAPSRIEVTSGVDDRLAGLAAGLEIACPEDPPAWAIAAACATVQEYLATLVWEPDDHLEWPRRDFDPARLAFGAPRSDDAQLRLSTFEHPRAWTTLDRLWRDGKTARVDRSWGRYVVLASARVRILRYNDRLGTVAVPRQVPLPRLFARSLALSSGRPPTRAPGAGLGDLLYSEVPRGVFDVIQSKLGQG